MSDLGSKSGTMVNGKRIRSRHRVTIDDEITFGVSTYSLKRGEEFDGELRHHWFFSKVSSKPSVSAPLLLILVTLFHIFTAVEICISYEQFRFDVIEPSLLD